MQDLLRNREPYTRGYTEQGPTTVWMFLKSYASTEQGLTMVWMFLKLYASAKQGLTVV